MTIGDKVRLLDEEGVFTIRDINSSYYILEDEHGFTQEYSLQEIVPNLDPTKLKININKEIITSKKEVKHKSIKRELLNPPRVVDLHIGHLVDSLKNMTPHQMLDKQIFIAKKELEQAKRDRIKKLILIHGKGNGVLKEAVYHLLESTTGIEYYEADIVRYNFGAVQIDFK